MNELNLCLCIQSVFNLNIAGEKKSHKLIFLYFHDHNLTWVLTTALEFCCSSLNVPMRFSITIDYKLVTSS